MSENNSKKNNQSNAPMIATIIVAVMAIAAVIVLIVVMNTKQNEPSRPNSSETSFRPTQELADECGLKAHDLVGKSYEIIKLFVTEGLPHYDEPYGNEPEDGVYTVNSKDYTSLEQIEKLVKSVYVEAEAERILHNLDGNGLEVYKNREILTDAVYTDDASGETGESGEAPETGEIVETGESSENASESRPAYVKQTVLGISAGFKPDTSYNRAWATSRIEVIPVSETQCHLTIYLGADENTDLSSVASDSILETAMVKRNGEWLLSVFVY